jgi:virginiamycin B lyase
MVLAAACLFSLAAFPPHSHSQTPALPNGAGKELVEAICTGCHQTNQITRSAGYTEDGWKELAGTMIDLSGGPEEQAEILAYLAEHFLPNDRRAPTLIDGDMEIAFTEWVAPTLGQRARDPVEAADGSIWWAGQWGNLIGRIDPATGEMTEYLLPAEAKPHSINIDRDGIAWYTGNGNGTIGKLDPKTGEITEFAMPDAAARDPHTAEFDADGILWFTLQQSNMVGRLDPKTGDVKLAKMKTAGARPYGIKIARNGTPWVACNGSNCLVRIDPATMEPTEIELPLDGTTVRRLDIAGDGAIWYVNSSKGRLGRFNPETGEIKEWPSPSGPDSHPYALAVVDGIVWYNESGKRPDALVRFDPASETFQSWAIPSGYIHAGIVRHMRPASDGSLLIHQSSTNRIIRATPSVAMD